MVTIAPCPSCGVVIEQANLLGIAKTGGQIVLGFQCPKCGLSATFRLTEQQYALITKQAIPPDPQEVSREIGRKVKAFAMIDLADLDTPEYLERLWHDQLVFAPESIPKEMAKS